MNITKIEKKLIAKTNLSEEEINFVLTYICDKIYEIINSPTYENTCDLIQGLIGRYLQSLDVSIYPCQTNHCIAPNVIGHSFLVASFNNNDYYLIDPSFIQFLILEDQYEDLYINHVKVKSKSPIYYAKNLNQKLLKQFLKQGFYKLTKDFAFVYSNAFYQPSTNILDNTILKNIEGDILIQKFIKSDEKLRDYGYPNIKRSV